MGLADLVRAVEDAFARLGPQEEIGRVVVAYRVSIRDKIKLIVKTLQARGKSRFFSLIGKSRTRLEIVVTFLAILELVKVNRVNVSQKALFEDIYLEPLGEWDDSEEIESEFGD
jgi:segregation and condensation protein A